MATNEWIVVAVIAALVVIAAVIWAGRKKHDAHRRVRAEEIRERLRREDSQVRQREFVAAETEARARAAKAEADAKAAQAERLQRAADARRGEVSEARERLAQDREYAERLDPSASGRSERQTPS